MLMLYTLIFAPAISMIFTYPVKSRLDIFFQVPNTEVEKDRLTEINLTIKNKSILPAPFITVSFIEALNLSISHPPNISIFLGPMQSKTITVGYRAKCRGVAKIGVKSIILKDYMGVLKISLLDEIKEKKNMGELIVTPKLVHIKPNNKIIKNSNDANSKEDTANAANNLLTWGGEPGYEFRQYIPGDPLHKIHWKLSAKNDSLMVRKEEGTGVVKKVLIVDSYINSHGVEKTQKRDLLARLKSKKSESQKGEEVLIVEEKVLEAVIAIANANVVFGREVDVWLFEGNKWDRYPLADTKNISQLQHRLAHFEFKWSLDSKSSNRIPPVNIIAQNGQKRYSEIGDAVVFTGNEDNLLANEINKFLDFGVSIDLVMIKGFEDSESNEKNTLFSRARVGSLWVIDAVEDLNRVFL
ncbi:DUF58 domain-containing protein [Herbivorax sp. ANBcel31]|uniref:DUF58 domain-containing protein n=1 Tax=Herbivorax sp. ANBcel31 TaxID=3069754 RepID=UPI0027B80AF3|nr:DUF58 domain-containing protein [Herbivorax sp. ANBcel31]MDQ2084832.1 DUF58 domain-containing protein [Herbivorax sp. ANBcel31]